jgi:hypothetical protein
VFLASQVKANDRGFLSKDITVKELIQHRGDIHHVFPKEYLKANDKKKNDYNQIANYVYMQQEINIQVGKKPPNVYFAELQHQCNGGEKKYGGITDMNSLKGNLAMNCVPEAVFNMEVSDYETFQSERRKMMALKIKGYYMSL